MQTYQCHKRVKAAKIVEIVASTIERHPGGKREMLVKFDETIGGRALRLEGEILARHLPVVGDYLVEYEDGYRSISPAKAFEDGYALVLGAGLDFGAAIRALKAGKRVARAGWNGKGMFLFLVPGSRFKVNRPPLLGIYPEGHEVDYHAHVDMKTAQGDVVPWLASQTDMLANDWQIVEA